MARLSRLQPLIGSAPLRVGYDTGDVRAYDKHRSNVGPHRAWYKTARWSRLRMDTFVKDHFTCRMCGKLEGNTSRLVCDHKTPHRGNANLFWDAENLQTLCASPCHNSKKQKEEQSSVKGVWD